MNWMNLVNYFAGNWLEIAGVVTAIVSIWLTTKRRIACWPIGLISDVIYVVVFYRARLFSDALLNAGSLPLAVYGWWYWMRGAREEGEVRVIRLPLRNLLIGLAAGAVGGYALSIWMKHIHAALPLLDSMLTSYSVVGGWWSVRKHIANWWLWIVVDVIYVGEFIYKDLRATALLYAGLVALAVLGLREWQRAAQASERAAAEAASQIARCATLSSGLPSI
jgi:nicotinamide mononucleotide transporter